MDNYYLNNAVYLVGSWIRSGGIIRRAPTRYAGGTRELGS
jgi:hypothetical protein